MCNPIRLAARPANCHAALVALCDGRSAEALFDFDAGSQGGRDRLGVPLEQDEGPSVELVDVRIASVSILDTLSEDDLGYIVDQLLGLDRPAPSPIVARRPTGQSFAEEAELSPCVKCGELCDALAYACPDCESRIETELAAILPFPTLSLPEPPAAA